MKNSLRFLTVLFLVLPLSSLLWDLFEMPAMLDLSKDNYGTLQGLSSGLSWLVIFEAAGLLLTVILIAMERQKRRMFRSLLVAIVCFAVSIAAFLIFVLPADLSTEYWTDLPEDWETLRAQWEYATAARAIFSLTGFGFIIFALLQNRNYHRIYSQWSVVS